MSNTVAIAAVTSTIRHLLHESLGGNEPGAVPDAEVTTLRPDQLVDRPGRAVSRAGLNVHLYNVTWSQAPRLHDQPFRGSTGSWGQQAQTALDLHYLVSAHGDETALEPQRLLARAVQALAATPVLSSQVIEAAIAAHGSGDTAFLTQSDLAEQPEPVKLVPTPLAVAEVSALWAALATPPLLSLTYTASTVLVESGQLPAPG